MRIYVSGRYRHRDRRNTDRFVAIADAAARELARRGHTPFCPHMMTNHWESDPAFEDEDFLRINRDWLRLCDAILLLSNWRRSYGARLELRIAKEIGLRVFKSLAEVPRRRRAS